MLCGRFRVDAGAAILPLDFRQTKVDRTELLRLEIGLVFGGGFLLISAHTCAPVRRLYLRPNRPNTVDGGTEPVWVRNGAELFYRDEVSWWTHKIRGLHRNDFIMAQKTNAFYGAHSPARPS